MLIQTQEGDLINFNHVTKIYIRKYDEDKFTVVARILPDGDREFLTTGLTEEQANAVMQYLREWLAAGSPVIDVNIPLSKK